MGAWANRDVLRGPTGPREKAGDDRSLQRARQPARSRAAPRRSEGVTAASHRRHFRAAALDPLSPRSRPTRDRRAPHARRGQVPPALGTDRRPRVDSIEPLHRRCAAVQNRCMTRRATRSRHARDTPGPRLRRRRGAVRKKKIAQESPTSADERRSGQVVGFVVSNQGGVLGWPRRRRLRRRSAPRRRRARRRPAAAENARRT